MFNTKVLLSLNKVQIRNEAWSLWNYKHLA